MDKVDDASTPATPPTPGVEVKSRKRDTLDLVISGLQRMRPKSGDADYEIKRSTKTIIGSIKFVLLTGNKEFDGKVGGFPFGRITEIFGLESSGKTSLARLAVIRAQLGEIYRRVFDENGRCTHLEKVDPSKIDVVQIYLDNEMSIDSDDKIEFYDSDSGKLTRIDAGLGCCDTVDQMFKIVERTIQIAEEHKTPEREQFIVIVVDTVAGTSSKEEMSQAWDKEDYPRQPKELRRGFRRLIRLINRRNVCMICTNQVSDSYKAKIGKRPMTNTPQEGDFNSWGGRALKFYASLRVFTYKMDRKYVLIRGARFPAGFLLGFVATKNRIMMPLREGRLALLFARGSVTDSGIDNKFSMLEGLLFSRVADESDTGDIHFRFEKFGVPTTTFTPRNDELQSRSRDRDPSIENKSQWPEFYDGHKEDLDRLFAKSIEIAFSIDGLNGVLAKEDDDDEVDDEEDLD